MKDRSGEVISLRDPEFHKIADAIERAQKLIAELNMGYHNKNKVRERGGITIEDKVLIAPKVNLVTINHPLSPTQRRSTVSKPIIIKRGHG
ncbi:hypothetical protein ACE3MQ_01800 [Paenibacillus lentus]|uniref:hypothetical protein n=1 Tax=Paenibacillus lentus TaxID=1338368 RepID=UPI00365DEA1B